LCGRNEGDYDEPDAYSKKVVALASRNSVLVHRVASRVVTQALPSDSLLT
jgi:hypothetical protein